MLLRAIVQPALPDGPKNPNSGEICGLWLLVAGVVTVGPEGVYRILLSGFRV